MADPTPCVRGWRSHQCVHMAYVRCALALPYSMHEVPCSIIPVHLAYVIQVAERVRIDQRVTILERTNLRHLRLTDLPGSQPVDMVTLDLSFISVLAVMSPITALMTPSASLVVLIKPQFEAARHQVTPHQAPYQGTPLQSLVGMQGSLLQSIRPSLLSLHARMP